MKYIILLVILIFLIYPLTCFLEAGHFEVPEKECFFETAFLNNTSNSVALIVSLIIFPVIFILFKTGALSFLKSPTNFLSNFKIPIFSPLNFAYHQAIIDPQE